VRQKQKDKNDELTMMEKKLIIANGKEAGKGITCKIIFMTKPVNS
jgi:hypothetical protein